MSYKKLAQDQHATPTKGEYQARDRAANIARYEKCGDERQYELHKMPPERARIITATFPKKGKG